MWSQDHKIYLVWKKYNCVTQIPDCSSLQTIRNIQWFEGFIFKWLRIILSVHKFHASSISFLYYIFNHLKWKLFEKIWIFLEIDPIYSQRESDQWEINNETMFKFKTDQSHSWFVQVRRIQVRPRIHPFCPNKGLRMSFSHLTKRHFFFFFCSSIFWWFLQIQGQFSFAFLKNRKVLDRY